MISKGEINRAGDILIAAESESEEYEKALQIVYTWRSSHLIPLQEIQDVLRERAKKIDRTSEVVGRPKRLPSILAKLIRFEGMRLARMQDIGGCRALLPSVEHVYELLSFYEKQNFAGGRSQPLLVRIFDYIKQPKPDGYRSIHVVLNLTGAMGSEDSFSDHNIEIQIRTFRQHHWATAVETASTFLGEGLKSSQGDSAWLRFFALAASVFAIQENCNIVPNTPDKQIDLVSELRNLWYQLQADAFLESCRSVVENVGEFENSKDFLLVFDSGAKSVEVRGFADGDC